MDTNQPRADKEPRSDPEAEEQEETQSESKSEEKSSSTTSASSNEEEGNKCMDAMDFIARKAKGIVIEKAKKSETETGKAKGIVIEEAKKSEVKTGKSKGKALASSAAGKRRKRAQGGLRKSLSLVSGLNELGTTLSSSDSEHEVPTNADVVGLKKQKGKANEEEADVFQGSETDLEEACKRIKKDTNHDDDTDDSDGGGGGRGTHRNLSSLGLQLVAGK